MGRLNNPDYIHGRNVDSPVYGLVGSQYGESGESKNGKRPTTNSPMIITSTQPGVMLNDDLYWTTTYAASYDSYLTIINGKKVQGTIDEITTTDVYKDGWTNADDDNLWKSANGVQQIQYMASKEDVDTASAAVDNFGEVSEARGFGIRLPAMAGGWGRTIDLLPTDPEATDDTTGRKNDESHKLARETWEYGPIDARWDYRRGVWATYNDLIADHEDEGLGTWVFSTNPDSAEGFPFLRGKLEDVWWVRQPLDLDGTSGRVQGSQTARVMTHLRHEWYDESEDGSAPLESIFIIPHAVSTDPDCHPMEAENTLGGETTGDSMIIDIKSSVHFFKEPGLDGNILFGRNARELRVCCDIDDEANWFLGEMVFVPKNYKTEFCPDTASPDECVWQPAIQIDECQLVGEHFLKLVDNDQSVALMVCELCDEIKTWSAALTAVIASNDAILEDRIRKTQDALRKAVKDLCSFIIQALTAANNFSLSLHEKQEKALDQLICRIFGDAQVIDGQVFDTPGITGKINETLNECIGKAPFLGETEVRDANGLSPGDEVDNEDGTTSTFDPNTATVFKPFVVLCPPGVFIAEPFKCDVIIDLGTTTLLDTPDPFENCPSVNLSFPCGEPSSFSVDCAVPMPVTLSTEFGECQAK